MNEIIAAVGAIINEAETMKGSYFYSPISYASARRSYEKRHSHDEVSWTEGGHTYTAKYEVRCTCRSVHAYGVYTKDGNKTTLTAIRNSYKRLMTKEA